MTRNNKGGVLVMALAMIVLALAAGLAGYALAKQHGDAELAQAQQTAKDAADAVAGKIRALEAARVADIDAIAIAHEKEMDDAKAQMDSLRAAVRAGAVRLSVPVKSAACPAAASGNPAAAGEPAETRAELVPAAADALIGIAADGDAAVRDLNSCIDAYESIRNRKP